MTVDTYLTLAAPCDAEPPKAKRSRFVAHAVPVPDADAALAVVAGIRQAEYSATHHVWAYRLGPDAPAPRLSDDGEPSGSAGAPVLREIEGRSLHHAVVVVTRYYGGTKLGVGGLARAYAEAAGAALDAAVKRRVVLRETVRLAFAFSDTSPAMRLLDRFDALVADQSHSARGTELALAVKRSEVGALRDAFVEATGGRGRLLG